MRSEIDNYKTSQLNQQYLIRNKNQKKYLEIKKMYETEKDKREKEMEKNRILGIRRAYNKIKERCKILIHGIEVEEKMSFLFYYFNFSYLDTFLYITFVDKIGE